MLAFLILPVSAASQSEVLPVRVNVYEAISLVVEPEEAYNVDGNMEVDLDANSYVEAKMTVKAATNCVDGLSVVMNDADENTNLEHTEGLASIPASGSQPEAGEAAWSVKGGLLTDFTMMPKYSENGALVIRTSVATGNEMYDEAELTFGFAARPAQTIGQYRDQIIFTASVNAIHVP